MFFAVLSVVASLIAIVWLFAAGIHGAASVYADVHLYNERKKQSQELFRQAVQGFTYDDFIELAKAGYSIEKIEDIPGYPSTQEMRKALCHLAGKAKS